MSQPWKSPRPKPTWSPKAPEPVGTAAEWQDRAWQFFADRGGWVPLSEYSAEFGLYLTPGQGQTDLRNLIKAGRLEVREDPTGARTPRGFPKREYRAVSP